MKPESLKARNLEMLYKNDFKASNYERIFLKRKIVESIERS